MTIQIRMFFPEATELTRNTATMCADLILPGTFNYHRNINKGTIVYGRIKKEQLHGLHHTWNTFRHGNLVVQRFLLYFPGHHYVHTLAYLEEESFGGFTTENLEKHWFIKGATVDENLIKVIDSKTMKINRLSVITLIPKEQNIAALKQCIDHENGQTDNIKYFVSPHTTREFRLANQKTVENALGKKTTGPPPKQSTAVTKTTNTNKSSNSTPTTTVTTTITPTPTPTSSSPSSTSNTTSSKNNTINTPTTRNSSSSTRSSSVQGSILRPANGRNPPWK
ncbi:hypothetical protein DLAC_03978 [Tieghemostelium lacteum]|uniref:Uncharacterized protein n=1 Tax=Tieghemostelium lacteum TaxID=361077 RepID=A0A151ZRZ3_TIELA|nr:hypothetical protein DLAC_03978 [Tieghemostelium lacteum]|eukprot:KYQ96689.1 hypothetical protein DLAC_03978 [Tieghemostelium lacteum]